MLTWVQTAHRSYLISALVVIATVLASLIATPCLSADDAAALESRLSIRLNWVQFTVVGGRITARTTYLDTNMSATSSDATGRRESMSLDVSAGVPSVQYRLITANERLSIEASGGERITIERTGAGGKRRVEFVQLPGQPISFIVEMDGSRRSYQSQSIWQLMLEAPRDCQEHLLPLLDLMRPGWNLRTQTLTIEQLLLRTALKNKQHDYKQWERWVDQLGNPQFSQRQAAERRLVDAGPATRSFLMRFDRRKLDAEQRWRIRRVLDAIGELQEDTSERTADDLLTEPAVWLALFDRDDLGTRRTAAKQLRLLLGSETDVDPQGSPETRKGQAAKIRELLDRQRRAP